MRRVNEQDELYRYVAQELAEPTLCDKIPWAVESPGGIFLAPSYERSNCYAFIAGRTKDPWLCWNVRRLGALSLLSRQTSLWSCLGDAWHGMNAGVAVSQAGLVGFFATLGYDPDSLHLEGITPPAVSIKDIYRTLPDHPDVVSRIAKAINASGWAPNTTDRDATNAAYLADIAALVTNDPTWCTRIPEELQLPSQAARFRDWCLFTLASNSKNAELCRRIPIRANEIDPRLSLQAKCDSQARSPYPGGQYGPEVPDDDQARAIVLALKYQIPQAKDLPVGNIYAAYDRFLHELNHRTDPQHLAARQRFIERVQRLP
jgi:hypothetical protein